MKQKILCLIATTSLLAGCGSLPQPGSVAAKIHPSSADKTSMAECMTSSTGTCYFHFGFPGRSTVGGAMRTLAVAAGSSVPVELPTEPVPYCVTYSEQSLALCKAQANLLISKTGLTVTATLKVLW